MPSNPSEALLVIQIGVLRFNSIFLCSLDSKALLKVTPGNVYKVVVLPLREPMAVILTNVLEITVFIEELAPPHVHRGAY